MTQEPRRPHHRYGRPLGAAGPARASFPGPNGLLGYGYSYEDGGINQGNGDEVTFSGGENRGHRPLREGGRSRSDAAAVYVLGRRDHRPRRVAPTGSSGPSWSPGGGHLAFAYRRRIYLARRDGSHRRPLISAKPFYSASDPAWSPGGGLVAYADGTVVRVADLRGHLLRSADQSGAEGDFLTGLDWQAVPRK